MGGRVRKLLHATCLPAALCAWGGDAALAQDALQVSGRLLESAGVVQIEGASGGGLVPWATIAGYGTDNQIGGEIHDTGVATKDFIVNGAGVAAGIDDRVELSYAHDVLYTGAAGARLGLGRGYQLALDVAGAKIRLFGHLVYDQDTWVPQVAVGTQVKWADAHGAIRMAGGRDAAGADFYVAATKLFLAQSLLFDLTLRATRANQFGLLGFGGPGGDGYHVKPEASVAWLVTRRLAVGAEWRAKPDDLAPAREDAAYDVFATFFASKHVSATLAYNGLGHVSRQGVQDGAYFSLVAGF